jgi:hypothetical protein
MLPVFICFLNSCQDRKENAAVGEKPRAIETARMDDYVKTDLLQLLTNAGSAASKKIDDNTELYFFPVVHYYYSHTDYAPIWSSRKNGNPIPIP